MNFIWRQQWAPHQHFKCAIKLCELFLFLVGFFRLPCSNGSSSWIVVLRSDEHSPKNTTEFVFNLVASLSTDRIVFNYFDVENVRKRFLRLWWWCVRWTRTTAKISSTTAAATTIYTRFKCCTRNNYRMHRRWNVWFGCLCRNSGKFFSFWIKFPFILWLTHFLSMENFVKIFWTQFMWICYVTICITPNWKPI